MFDCGEEEHAYQDGEHEGAGDAAEGAPAAAEDRGTPQKGCGYGGQGEAVAGGRVAPRGGRGEEEPGRGREDAPHHVSADPRARRTYAVGPRRLLVVPDGVDCDAERRPPEDQPEQDEEGYEDEGAREARVGEESGVGRGYLAAWLGQDLYSDPLEDGEGGERDHYRLQSAHRHEEAVEQAARGSDEQDDRAPSRHGPHAAALHLERGEAVGDVHHPADGEVYTPAQEDYGLPHRGEDERHRAVRRRGQLEVTREPAERGVEQHHVEDYRADQDKESEEQRYVLRREVRPPAAPLSRLRRGHLHPARRRPSPPGRRRGHRARPRSCPPA